MKTQKLVELIGISKSFPGVKALNDINIEFKKGEVHGIVGENGAGKSTLIKILTGVYQKDAGEILFRGNKVKINSPTDAQKYGLYAVYQETNIAPELSIGENLFLGRLPVDNLGIINWGLVYKESQKILSKYSLNLDTRRKITDLSSDEQVFITIVKVINEKAKLIIFDEPTAKLKNEQVVILFNIINQLKESGIAIVYISHNLKEVFEICDIVTVLRDGAKVITSPIHQLDQDKLISLMVGRSFEDMYKIIHVKHEETILEVENLTKKPFFNNISFKLYDGEIIGFYGLVGSGRTAVMRTLFGAEKAESGKIRIRGIEIKLREPYDAINYGIGMLPEDRRSQGLALPLDVETNINITSYDSISRMGLLIIKKAEARARKYVKDLNIKTPSISQIVSKLSGGTQQKVIVSRWLAKNSNILILDEPTVGIDVGAKYEIYRLIENMVHQGKSLIIISSYLPEIIGLSERIYIMANGKIIDEVSGENKNEEYILRVATNLKQEQD